MTGDESALRQAPAAAAEAVQKHNIIVENVPKTMEALQRWEVKRPGFWQG